jgi:hypothetical protein
MKPNMAQVLLMLTDLWVLRTSNFTLRPHPSSWNGIMYAGERSALQDHVKP